MKFSGEIIELKRGLEIINYNRLPKEVSLNVKKGFNGLKIKGENNKFTIEYGEKSDFFRALALVEGITADGETSIDITEIKKFDSCGVMIDCSRNSVPRVDVLKDLFARMAKMGLNLVLLYTEETYTLDDYPYFGYMRGRYSKEDLKELDQFALSLGIELVPCIQTLAHLDMALRWPAHAPMADDQRTLLVDDDRTYKLIDAMLKTCRECFTTDRIHIGMDEAHGLGRGKYLDKNGYEPSDKIFLRHLKKVESMTEKYGFKPMMWDDMFFRYSSKKGAYYDLEAVLDSEIKKEIPKNIAQVFWNYYKESNEEYEIFFNQRKDMNNEIIFAGGIWTWYTLGVCYRKTFRATRPALEECHKSGVKTVFGTIWDGGHGGYLDLYGSLLGMQLYAEYMYYEKVSDEHIKRYFKLCTGYDSDAFMALDIDNYPDEWCHEYPYEADTQDPNVSKQVLYQDLLLGLFDKNFESVDLKGFYKDRLNTLSSVEVPCDLEDLFDYHKTIVSILCDKCDMGIRIHKAYKNKDVEAIKAIVEEIGCVKERVIILKEQMYTLWHKHHRAFGWELSDLRLSALAGRLETIQRKLLEFSLNSDIIIEELEEERLMFGPVDVVPGKSLVTCIRYPLISSPALSIR